MNGPTPAVPILQDVPDDLLGPRVRLAPFGPGDGGVLWEAIEESREYLSAWLDWVEHTREPADTEVYARRARARWLLREDLVMGIWERGTGRFLGSANLLPLDWKVPSFNIGYWLRASAEGHGYMTEAVALLCGLAFETLSANRVRIQCDALNVRSAAIPRRLGFVHEARMRNHEAVRRNSPRGAQGGLRDWLVFAMIAEEYARAAWRL